MVAKVETLRGQDEWDYQRLRSFAAFADVQDEVLASVAEKCKYHRLPPLCAVVEQDQPAAAIYLLLSGSITYSVESSDCRELTVGCGRAPWYFGLVGVLRSGIHASSVISSTEIEVLELPGIHIDSVLSQCPRLAVELIKVGAAAYAMAVRRLGDHVFLTAEERTTAVLLDLAIESGAASTTVSSAPDWRVVRGLAHSRLAHLANTSRETVCRTMGRLASMQIVVPKGSGSSAVHDYIIELKALAAVQATANWPRVSRQPTRVAAPLLRKVAAHERTEPQRRTAP